MVRRIGFGLVLWGMMALLGAPAEAGLHHTQDAGTCRDCHKPGTGSADATALIACLITSTPRSTSFRPMDVNQTCLECHGGLGGTGDGPSVVSGGNVTGIRQAGFLNGPGGLAHAGHTLGSTVPAPGGTWTPGSQGMTCTDCHNPHGETSQYRNLVLRPRSATEDRRVTFVLGPSNDLRMDVWIRTDPGCPGKCDARAIRFNQPGPGRSAYGEWCQGCHTAFHGPAGAPNMGGLTGWHRHPTSDGRIGGGPRRRTSLSRHAGLSNRVPVLSASGVWPASDNTPSCMSCHKAHGNQNPFGLLYMAGQGQLTENGDSQGKIYVDLCHQCHTQGLGQGPDKIPMAAGLLQHSGKRLRAQNARQISGQRLQSWKRADSSRYLRQAPRLPPSWTDLRLHIGP